jgi:hypothetical protein
MAANRTPLNAVQRTVGNYVGWYCKWCGDPIFWINGEPWCWIGSLRDSHPQ